MAGSKSKSKNWMTICYSIHGKKVVDFARYHHRSSACSILKQMADDEFEKIKRDYNGDDIVFEVNDDWSRASLSWRNGEREFVWEAIKIESNNGHKIRDEYANSNKKKSKKSKKEEEYHRLYKAPIGLVADMYDDYKWSGNPIVTCSYYDEQSESTKTVEVDMSDDRYANFFEHGIECVKCGLKGEYFWLETCGYGKNNKYAKPHFNLYGRDNNGREVMLTKDHVQPSSRGGLDALENYQCLCKHCNESKGNRLEEEL